MALADRYQRQIIDELPQSRELIPRSTFRSDSHSRRLTVTVLCEAPLRREISCGKGAEFGGSFKLLQASPDVVRATGGCRWL